MIGPIPAPNIVINEEHATTLETNPAPNIAINEGTYSINDILQTIAETTIKEGCPTIRLAQTVATPIQNQQA